jgi:hypothetical protein
MQKSHTMNIARSYATSCVRTVCPKAKLSISMEQLNLLTVVTTLLILSDYLQGCSTVNRIHGLETR